MDASVWLIISALRPQWIQSNWESLPTSCFIPASASSVSVSSYVGGDLTAARTAVLQPNLAAVGNFRVSPKVPARGSCSGTSQKKHSVLRTLGEKELLRHK